MEQRRIEVVLTDETVMQFFEGNNYDTYEVNYGMLIFKKGDRWTGGITLENVKYFREYNWW